jgi:hypothetical protein
MSSDLQLVKIEHIRCAEPRGFTLVWAPANLGKKEIRELIQKAQGAYTRVSKAFSDTPAPNDYKPYGGPPYDQFPGFTVEEVKQAWEEKGVIYKAWKVEQDKARQPFAHYLEEVGLQEFWRHDPEVSLELDWGHRHGQAINASDTEMLYIVGKKVVNFGF